MSDPAERPSVLFVCLGNICRSPAAEGVLRHLLDARGLDGAVEVDSAGTSAYHAGQPADARMRRAAAARGIRLGSRSRRVERADLERFDLVLAMDRDNLRDLRSLGAGRAEVRLYSDFLPEGEPADIPDPYYGGGDGFERVLDLLEAASPAILDRLTAG